MAAKKRKKTGKRSGGGKRGELKMPPEARAHMKALRAEGRMPFIDGEGNISSTVAQRGAKRGHRSCR